MIVDADRMFKRWASWMLAPTPGLSLGLGKNIMQKLVEGKGQFLPGSPRGSGPSNNYDPVAVKVEEFLKTRSRAEKTLIKTFYLSEYWTAQQKADRLKIPRRTMYSQVERVQAALMAYLEPPRA